MHDPEAGEVYGAMDGLGPSSAVRSRSRAESKPRVHDYSRSLSTNDSNHELTPVQGSHVAAEFLNRRWMGYTELSAEDATDWGWTAAVHTEDRDGFMNF